MHEPFLEKVTALITRQGCAGRELLVFWHAASGVQLPAGTVEAGESVEQAVLREVFEETGLTSVQLLRKIPYMLTQDLTTASSGVLLGPVELLEEPAADAVPNGCWLKRGSRVSIIRHAGPWSLVAHEEWNLDVEPPVVILHIEGWLSAHLLATRLIRHFFHLSPILPTPDTWEIFAEDRYTFQLYWTPLIPRPCLVQGQDEWLASIYKELFIP